MILAILIAMIMNKQTKIIFAIKKKVLVKSFDLVKPKMNVGPTESRYMMINVVLMIFSSFLENINLFLNPFGNENS